MIFSSKDCVLRIRKTIVVEFSSPPVKSGGIILGGGGRGPPPGNFLEIFIGNFRKFPEKFPAFTSLVIKTFSREKGGAVIIATHNVLYIYIYQS